MIIKKINTKLLLLGLAATVVLGSCSQSSKPDPEIVNSDPTVIQDQAVAPTIANYSVNVDEKGRALRGYDPITYFSDEGPIQGRQEFSFQWNDAEYYFASAENRDKFISNPEEYAPANGGYCTFGVVLAKKFDGDPEVWSVHNDRLHVFLNEEVQEKFLQDESGNLGRVSENWPIIQDKSPEELDAAS